MVKTEAYGQEFLCIREAILNEPGKRYVFGLSAVCACVRRSAFCACLRAYATRPDLHAVVYGLYTTVQNYTHDGRKPKGWDLWNYCNTGYLASSSLFTPPHFLGPCRPAAVAMENHDVTVWFWRYSQTAYSNFLQTGSKSMKFCTPINCVILINYGYRAKLNMKQFSTVYPQNLNMGQYTPKAKYKIYTT